MAHRIGSAAKLDLSVGKLPPSPSPGSALRRSVQSGGSAQGVPDRVRVALRLRPRNAEESAADTDFANCVELEPELMKNNCDTDTYEFDDVLSEHASQKRVCEAVAKPVVESVLNGYNGTMIAYGQTGTRLKHLPWDN
uniref:armadillo repeat-containing kinesin-like protein 2 n=1 Tax=Fragaria vesca subsp. vesca TaxID=101020 RepID=UPI0005C88335|nr:PREDICTED: armadillo repeat-containing kinesin-like protein 2 [Fragaria vesca subsp. vesca]